MFGYIAKPLIDITVLGVVLANFTEVIAKFTISGVSLTCFALKRCLNHCVPVYSFTRPGKS